MPLQGQLCVLAEDCNQPDYKKLVEALCAEHNVSLLSVPEAKQLGQWAGVSALHGTRSLDHVEHACRGPVHVRSSCMRSLPTLAQEVCTYMPHRSARYLPALNS